MKLTLPNGAVLEGTEEQILQLCEMLGHKVAMYKSSSKGMIPIVGMPTPHIRNALLVEYKEWLESLRKLSNTEFVVALQKGAGHNKPILIDLAQELDIRVKNGEV